MNELNVPLSTVVQRLSAVALVDDQSAINGSVAISHQVSPDQNNLILARYAASDGRSFSSTEQIHGELRLIRESTLIDDMRNRIAAAAESGLFELIEGLRIEVNNTASVELLPSDDPHTGCGGPKYVIQLSAPSRSRGHLSGAGPLVTYGQPSFESVEQAVRAWIGLRPFHGNSDGRLGCILIEVPLSTPRLGAIAMDGEQTMRIAIEGMPSKTPLELTGVWQSNDGASIEPFAQKVDGDSVGVFRPSWAAQVAVWLVRSDSLITDFFFENSGRCSRSRRVLYVPNAETNGNEPAVLAQIHAGEDENLEFKPFIELTSGKFAELIETVIAFANKRGGTIYLGVNDHQEIIGVEKELWKLTPKEKGTSVENCITWYAALVRKKICDRSSKNIEFHVDSIHAGGKLLIRVTVEEGKDKPYSDVITNEIWTRRGANTVRPNGEELKQLMVAVTHSRGFFE
jgi:hypothetical protein